MAEVVNYKAIFTLEAQVWWHTSQFRICSGEVALIQDLSSASTSPVIIITPPVFYAHFSAAGAVGHVEAVVWRESVLSPPQEV